MCHIFENGMTQGWQKWWWRMNRRWWQWQRHTQRLTHSVSWRTSDPKIRSQVYLGPIKSRDDIQVNLGSDLWVGCPSRHWVSETNVTNASCAIWWPNLELMLPCGPWPLLLASKTSLVRKWRPGSDKVGDKEKMESAWQEADIDQGAAQAVQLPQREADDLLLLDGNSAQDNGAQDTRISSRSSVQSTVKWSATQISDKQSRHTIGSRSKTKSGKLKFQVEGSNTICCTSKQFENWTVRESIPQWTQTTHNRESRYLGGNCLTS